MADQNEYRIKRIKTLMRRLAYAQEIEYTDFLVCRIPDAAKDLEKRYWLQNQMAFISLDIPNAVEMGEILYAANPGCRLIYYKNGMTELLPLLPSRPVWYWNCDDFDALAVIFCTQLQVIKMTVCSYIIRTVCVGWQYPMRRFTAVIPKEGMNRASQGAEANACIPIGYQPTMPEIYFSDGCRYMRFFYYCIRIGASGPEVELPAYQMVFRQRKRSWSCSGNFGQRTGLSCLRRNCWKRSWQIPNVPIWESWRSF